MNKLKVYQFAALALLLLNLVLLAIMALAPPPPNRTPRHFVEDFEFDESQHDRFMAYADNHNTKMVGYNARQTELLGAYFRQLTGPNATTPGPPPGELQDIEQQKIASTYDHFLEVKALLRPEQEEHFPEFVDAVLRQILLQPGKE